MKGYKYGGFGKEWAEVNGSVATAVYQMGDPNNLLFGKHGESLEPIPVPPEFLVIEGSPRDPSQGVPSAVFRCARRHVPRRYLLRVPLSVWFFVSLSDFICRSVLLSCLRCCRVCRYDIIYELTSAIIEDRPAVPSFKEGAVTQMVADSVIESSEKKSWVDIDYSAFQ